MSEKFFCNICKKRLSKKGDICTKCYEEMKEYDKKGFKNNEFLENISKEELKNISNKKILLKLQTKGEKALIIKRKYSFWFDSVFKKFDIQLIMLVIYLVSFAMYLENSPILIIPITILYILSVYILHRAIKYLVSEKVTTLYNDRIVQKNPILRKEKTIYYTKIYDIREEGFRFGKNKELVISENIGRGIDIYKTITIDTLNLNNEIAYYIVNITKFDASKREKTVYEVFKDLSKKEEK